MPGADLMENCGLYTSKDACATAADRMGVTSFMEVSHPKHPVRPPMKARSVPYTLTHVTPQDPPTLNLNMRIASCELLDCGLCHLT